MSDPTRSELDGRVYLHDLLHTLQTGIGVRPRPAGGKDASEMKPVPVLASVLGYSGGAEDAECGSVLIDVTRFEVFRGGPGDVAPRVVLFCELPDTHRLVDLSRFAVVPLAEEVPAGEEGEQTGTDAPNELPPELRHLDPAVYQVNTERPAGYSTQRERVPNESDLKSGG